MNAFRRIHLRLLAALIVLVFACGCEDSVPGTNVREKGEEEPDQILRNTRMTLTEKGRTSAVIEASTVRIFEKRDYTALEDSITIYFYNKDGELTSTLDALKGEIWGLYDETDSLKASGDVRIRSEENGAYMEAPAVRWILGEGVVYGVGLVRLNSENGYEEGTGFEAKDDLSEYRFRGPVSGEVRGEGSGILDGAK